MNTTELFTSDGRPVCTVSVPYFQIPVQVITWGLRTFVRDAASGQYREANGVWHCADTDQIPD